jgi:hypothetical protein
MISSPIRRIEAQRVIEEFVRLHRQDALLANVLDDGALLEVSLA